MAVLAAFYQWAVAERYCPAVPFTFVWGGRGYATRWSRWRATRRSCARRSGTRRSGTWSASSPGCSCARWPGWALTGRRTVSGWETARNAAMGGLVLALLQKQALRDVDPFTTTWLGCVAGVVVCLPFAPALGHEIGAAPRAATAGIVYMGLFPTAVAFATWSYALVHTSAGRLGSSS